MKDDQDGAFKPSPWWRKSSAMPFVIFPILAIAGR
jgi:hypothetical protein